VRHGRSHLLVISALLAVMRVASFAADGDPPAQQDPAAPERPLLPPVMSGLSAGPEPSTPVDVDQVEQVKVRLVLLDVLVLDAQQRTVPDLTREDFEILSGGNRVDIDTLDVACPGGAAEEPVGVRHASRRPGAVAPEAERRIVFAVDYQHLGRIERIEALEQARQMVEHGSVAGDRIMLVALNGGMRVEQTPTQDRETVLQSLERMEYDVSLYGRDFPHLNENGFMRGMTALLDVLGTMPGQKALVLFTTMRDVPLDLQFRQLAAHAAASRCSIYPVDVLGLPTDRMAPAAAPG